MVLDQETWNELSPVFYGSKKIGSILISIFCDFQLGLFCYVIERKKQLVFVVSKHRCTFASGLLVLFLVSVMQGKITVTDFNDL